MEVQLHGFTWQNELLRVYGATPEELRTLSYTEKDDLPGRFNRLQPGVSISVKTTGTRNSVCMGDALRVYDSVFSTQPIHIVVLTYTQTETTKQLQSIVEVDLTNSGPLLFGDLRRTDIEALDKLVKAIPHGRRSDDERYEYKELQATLAKSMTGLCLNPKIDSKKQRRLQCSFNRFIDFVQNNPGRVVAKCEMNGVFRDTQILTELKSSRRVLRRHSSPD